MMARAPAPQGLYVRPGGLLSQSEDLGPVRDINVVRRAAARRLPRSEGSGCTQIPLQRACPNSGFPARANRPGVCAGVACGHQCSPLNQALRTARMSLSKRNKW